MSGEQRVPAVAGGAISGKRVLLVGLMLVLGVTAAAWLLRPSVPAKRDTNLHSPKLTIGTSGRSARPAEFAQPQDATGQRPPSQRPSTDPATE